MFTIFIFDANHQYTPGKRAQHHLHIGVRLGISDYRTERALHFHQVKYHVSDNLTGHDKKKRCKEKITRQRNKNQKLTKQSPNKMRN